MSTSNLKHLFEVLTARPFLTVLMLFVAAVGSVGHGTGMSCGSSSAGSSNNVD
jgi:hypothetical protein